MQLFVSTARSDEATTRRDEAGKPVVALLTAIFCTFILGVALGLLLGLRYPA